MRWRRRIRRGAKWALIACAAVLALGWGASVCGWAQWLEYTQGYKAVFVGRGFVRAEARQGPWPAYGWNGWIPHNMRMGWTVGWYSRQQPIQGSWLWLPYACEEGKHQNAVVVVPLWCPFLVCAGLAGLLWRRDVMDRQWCYWCDYDRSGLEAGAVCPECGKGPR
jgi:hypothetical protein